MKSANQMTALPSWLGAGATWSLARAAIVVALAAFSSARADVVTDWNATALGLTTLSAPPAELRALAITHAAMFDAVNAITRSHAPYLVQPTAPADSSADAAAASAAHGVLLWLFPGAKTPLDAALAAAASAELSAGAVGCTRYGAWLRVIALTASNIAAWVIASARSSAGGALNVVRPSAVAFQSVTTSARAWASASSAANATLQGLRSNLAMSVFQWLMRAELHYARAGRAA